MKIVSRRERPYNVVIPCYNEANRLPQSEISDFLSAHSKWTATFVDDGSQDKTIDVLREMQKCWPDQISILKLRENSGKAEAVRIGMQYGLEELQASLVGFADADLAAPLQELLPIAEKLESRAELHAGLGIRLPLLGHQVKRKKTRALLCKVFLLLARPLLKAPYSDTQCGLKLFRNTSVVRQSLESPFRTKWIFDVELFQRIMCVHEQSQVSASETPGDLLYEHPLSEWSEVAGSKLRARDFVTAVVDLIRLYISKPLPSGCVLRFSNRVEVIRPISDATPGDYVDQAG